MIQPRARDSGRARPSPASPLYRALGDETRLRMIGLLGEIGPLPVNELRLAVGLSQPLISWHLRILRTAGLVETGPRAGRSCAPCAPAPSRRWPPRSAASSAAPAGCARRPRRGRCSMSASREHSRERDGATRSSPPGSRSRRAAAGAAHTAAQRPGVTPNTVTVIGLLITSSPSVLIWQGWLLLGAAVLAAGSLLDAVDGGLARAQGGGTPSAASWTAPSTAPARRSCTWASAVWS